MVATQNRYVQYLALPTYLGVHHGGQLPGQLVSCCDAQFGKHAVEVTLDGAFGEYKPRGNDSIG